MHPSPFKYYSLRYNDIKNDYINLRCCSIGVEDETEALNYQGVRSVSTPSILFVFLLACVGVGARVRSSFPH